ncbi:MAG: metal-sensitive transcriptional regulator [bacterium]|nr:metal-sensitive transcriptional regulator [bacterium]
MNMDETINNKQLIARLSRIEGQVRGISRMLDDGKYCIDVVNQITAARKALEKVALLVVQRHVNSCVKDAMAEGQGEEMTEELVQALDKFLR